MPTFEITLVDRSTELIGGADAYQQEGQLTTFFRTGSSRDVVDSWSTRIASYRTSEILAIRRLELIDATPDLVGAPLVSVQTA
ncbi:MAG: hypothetical protein GY745_23480 [Actinomycetia bacterium]|nr:hypothetical protein [Actinomycetes bacterium]MCP3910445.1 hypothetical protein [Actinomycetes bacterium]MCP4087978.1 hypothetical protein [Actinomycetes bacterium]